MKSLVRVIALAVLSIPVPVSAQVSSRYAGSAENAGMPGSPARIELSFFNRSDTISVGWLRIDPPLGGSGIAYTFSHPDSIVIVSVSQSGDTIRWLSPGSGPLLNGEYSILGGDSRGQSGTWSLSPQPDPSRPMLISTAILLGLAGVFSLLLLARRSQWRWWNWRSSGGPLASSAEVEKLSGVGGWLAWHMLGVGLVGAYLLVTVREVGEQVGTGIWMLDGVLSHVRPLLMLESAMHVFQLVAFAVGIYLVVQRRPETPLFFAFVLSALAAFGLVDLIFAGGLAAQMGSRLGAEFVGEATSEINKATRENLRLALFGLIWSLYWIRSKRVAVTFAPASVRSAWSTPSGMTKAGSSQEAEVASATNATEKNTQRTTSETANETNAGRAESTSDSTTAGAQNRAERACPWCAESILAQARYCKHCHREVDPVHKT